MCAQDAENSIHTRKSEGRKFEMITMTFLATKTPDGLIHVQNYVGGMSGQHHVHTAEDFSEWVKNSKIRKTDLTIRDGPCYCGIKPNQVRECDGIVWTNGGIPE